MSLFTTLVAPRLWGFVRCVFDRMLNAANVSAGTITIGSSNINRFIAVSFGLVLVAAQMGDAIAQSRATEIKICPYDTGAEDGDEIDVEFDGETIFSNLKLTNHEQCAEVLKQPGRYLLLVRALNTGSVGLNTAAVRIRDSAGQEKDSAAWDLETLDERSWYIEVSGDDIRVVDPGVRVSLSALTLDEGSRDTYTVELDSEPSGTVTVMVSGSNADVSVEPASLTFTQSNWNTSQTVTVHAAHDADSTDDSATLMLQASGGGYDGQSANVSVSISDDDMAVVKVTETPLTVPEGESGTYEVVLTSSPAGMATVTVLDGDSPAVTVSPETLTFDSGNWDIPQRVTVTAVQDDVADGGKTVVLAHRVSGYGNVTVADDVTVRIIDDDMAVVKVTETPLTVPEGESGTYEVVLTSSPAGMATVTVLDGDSPAVTVSPETLTFDSGNWDIPQRVTVTAVQDDVADGGKTVVLAHRVSGYGNVTVADDVTVRIIDDDMAVVKVTETPLTVPEGESGTYEVVLTSSPAGMATVTVLDGDSPAVTVSPETLTFDSGNWDIPQRVTVTAVQDDVADGGKTVVLAHRVSGYGNVTVADDVTVRIIDDDMAVVKVTETPLTVPEGESGTYEVVLTSSPAGMATVTVLDGDSPAVTVSPETLTFDSGNWDIPQRVTVTAVQDDVADGGKTVVLAHRVSGYGNVTVADDVTVRIIDDDMAVVKVTETPLTVPEGESGTYEVVLTSSPAGMATVTVLDGDSPAVMVSPETLTFDSGNWDIPQRVTVTAVQDDVADGGKTVVLAHRVSGYGNVTVADDVTVRIIDDDMAVVKVTETPLTVPEGESGTYEVVLTSSPAGMATVTVLDGDSPAVTVSPETLTFDSGNWDIPQRVTVTAVQDDVADGGKTVVLAHRVSGYGNVTVADDVTVTVEDDDIASVEVTETTLALPEGGNGRYELSLTSEPEGEVTVTVVSDDPGAVTALPERLTFDSGNWDDPQSVTVRAEDDAIPDDGKTVVLRHEVAGYGTVTVAHVTVSVMSDISDAKEVVEETLEAVVTSTLSNVTTNIGTRFSAARGGTAFTVAGQPIPIAESALALAAFHDHSDSALYNGHDSERRGRDLNLSRLLETSAFQVSLLAADENTQGVEPAQSLTVWGRVDRMFFDKESGDINRYGGDLKAGYLGIDTWLDDRWLIGVAASVTMVEADYGLGGTSGELGLSMLGVHPYLRLALDDLSELWVILGVSKGEITNSETGSAPEESNIIMYMGAAGTRRELTTIGGIDIALLGDAGFGSLRSDGRSGLQVVDNLSTDTWRARLGLSGSHTVLLADQATFTPFVEVMGRYDAGDDNVGIEIAGGIQYANPASGLGLEIRANILPLYSESDYREYGFSFSASASPGAGGEGLAMAISTSLGPETGNVAGLSSKDLFASAHPVVNLSEMLSINGEVGYGFPVVGARGVLTPFGQFRVRNDGGRQMHAGVRLGRMTSATPWNLELSGGQRTSEASDPEYLVSLLGRLRF